jgi:hypothetical protein
LTKAHLDFSIFVRLNSKPQLLAQAKIHHLKNKRFVQKTKFLIGTTQNKEIFAKD